MYRTMSSGFAEKYPVAATEYGNAVRLLEMEMVVGALSSARVSLEYMVKELCKKCGTDTSDSNVEIKLQDMINVLRENNVISEKEAVTMHQVRILCNKGAHPGEVAPELDDAREAVRMLADVLDFLSEKEADIDFDQKKSENNQPMLNTDYYSPKRKYRGEWSECYTRESLAVIPEYTGLLRKAEAGDISAMLDLAIGFVHKTPVWSPNQLFCLRYYRPISKYDSVQRKRVLKQPELTYDTRYFYWVTRACNQSITVLEKGGTYPKKYMANAFMDAIKFAILDYKRDRVEVIDRNEKLLYSNQYEMVRELYGKNLNTYFPYSFKWVCELLNMVSEAGTTDIISDLHYKEKSVEGIKYLGYCLCCVKHCNDLYELDICNIQGCELNSSMALLPEDIGKNVTIDVLTQREPEIMCQAGYREATNRCYSDVKREGEHKKRQEEEAARQRELEENPLLKAEIQKAQREREKKEAEKRLKERLKYAMCIIASTILLIAHFAAAMMLAIDLDSNSGQTLMFIPRLLMVFLINLIGGRLYKASIAMNSDIFWDNLELLLSLLYPVLSLVWCLALCMLSNNVLIVIVSYVIWFLLV
ncbi:MAG: DUF4145 domain-containing protein, partial [Lachnospiraceae bacterium]|nr:DUF4145 domain-containing protein [Lachnospiraceae bacterium]